MTESATMAVAARAAIKPLLWLMLGAALLSAPFWLGRYPVYLLNLVGIFALVGIGLNLLTGFAGQISLGHAAFFGIGAYATGLLTIAGVPFLLALLGAGLLTTAIGALVALPALRLQNLYLAIATLGFGVVVQKTLFEWRSLTGGGGGLTLKPAQIGPFVLSDEFGLYYVVLVAAALAAWTAANVARSRTGRALTMLRESEIAASALGINIARHKVTAFALSAFYTAVAGGLYAYLVRYVNPENFNLSLSIAFLSTIVIGGLGTIPGSILGAVFYVLVPELFRGFKDAPGLVFGLSLVLVMVFMPRGLWGIVAPRVRR